MKYCLIAMALLLVACPPSPLVATSGDIYVDACASLARAGCLEGTSTNCSDVLRRADTERFVDFHVTCLVAARSKSAVRDCGPEVECLAQ